MIDYTFKFQFHIVQLIKFQPFNQNIVYIQFFSVLNIFNVFYHQFSRT
jgi:hypothetical protein